MPTPLSPRWNASGAIYKTCTDSNAGHQMTSLPFFEERKSPTVVILRESGGSSNRRRRNGALFMRHRSAGVYWIPAFAGMTAVGYDPLPWAQERLP
jgi:hypothetical protein